MKATTKKQAATAPALVTKPAPKSAPAPVELELIPDVEPAPEPEPAPIPAPEPEPAPALDESALDEGEGKDYRINTHAQVVRNDRIPIPCWQSKDGGETSVSLLENDRIRYKVGQVEVVSTCMPMQDGTVIVRATASNKKLFVWDESIALRVPQESFKVLGLFGIGERLNTNTNKKPRGAFLETCFALVNGGYTAQSVLSYLAETAKEKAARLEREAAELAIRTATEIASEAAQFRALALACPSVSDKQTEWLTAMDSDTLLKTASSLMLAQFNTGRWAGLRDAALATGFKHIAIPDVPADDLL